MICHDPTPTTFCTAPYQSCCTNTPKSRKSNSFQPLPCPSGMPANVAPTDCTVRIHDGTGKPLLVFSGADITTPQRSGLALTSWVITLALPGVTTDSMTYICPSNAIKASLMDDTFTPPLCQSPCRVAAVPGRFRPSIPPFAPVKVISTPAYHATVLIPPVGLTHPYLDIQPGYCHGTPMEPNIASSACITATVSMIACSSPGLYGADISRL